MKKTMLMFMVTGLLMLGVATTLSATTIANYNVQGSWNDDYDIWVGVGDIYSPTWIQQVAWTGNGNWGETAGSIIVPDAYVWNQTWWLKADDNWGSDVGNIIYFDLTNEFGTFISPDPPVYIPDTALRYAYIQMPSNPIPEPATMLLLGTGLVGLAGARRKFKK